MLGLVLTVLVYGGYIVWLFTASGEISDDLGMAVHAYEVARPAAEA